MTTTSNIAAVLLAASASLLAEPHTGYWVKSTPHRTESRQCMIVRNEEALRRELEAIRWGVDSIPDVEWANDIAVIVAPQQSHPGWSLRLFKVADPDTNPAIEWGWHEPSKSSSFTYGGIIDNGPAAIIVALPRDVAERGLRCRAVKVQ
jgi:hypothetical protein